MGDATPSGIATFRAAAARNGAVRKSDEIGKSTARRSKRVRGGASRRLRGTLSTRGAKRVAFGASARSTRRGQVRPEVRRSVRSISRHFRAKSGSTELSASTRESRRPFHHAPRSRVATATPPRHAPSSAAARPTCQFRHFCAPHHLALSGAQRCNAGRYSEPYSQTRSHSALPRAGARRTPSGDTRALRYRKRSVFTCAFFGCARREVASGARCRRGPPTPSARGRYAARARLRATTGPFDASELSESAQVAKSAAAPACGIVSSSCTSSSTSAASSASSARAR